MRLLVKSCQCGCGSASQRVCCRGALQHATLQRPLQRCAAALRLSSSRWGGQLPMAKFSACGMQVECGSSRTYERFCSLWPAFCSKVVRRLPTFATFIRHSVAAAGRFLTPWDHKLKCIKRKHISQCRNCVRHGFCLRSAQHSMLLADWLFCADVCSLSTEAQPADAFSVVSSALVQR